MTSWYSLALGAVFAGSGAWELSRGLRARRWPTAVGRVLEASAQVRQSRGRRYVPAVRYAYTVGSEELVGTRLAFGWDRLYGSPEAAERALAGLAADAAVHVYYNPANPRDAVLRPGGSLVSAGLLVAGLGVIALSIRR